MMISITLASQMHAWKQITEKKDSPSMIAPYSSQDYSSSWVSSRDALYAFLLSASTALMRAIDFFTLYIFSVVALVCVGSLTRLTFVWWVSKAFRSLYNTSQSAWRSSKDFRRRWEADQLVPVCSGDIPSFVRRNSFNPKRGNCDFWLDDEDSDRRCNWSTCTNGDATYVSNVEIEKYRCFIGQIDLRTQHTIALLMSLQLLR